MSTITKSITVDVPIRTAYDQWTQLESFPRFMDGVEAVAQQDDTHVHWKAKIGGVRREWVAEIVDQAPDERITWRTVDGVPSQGTVLFAAADPATTQVTVRLDYEPAGLAGKVADLFHVVDHKVAGDLERFKAFIEARGRATGAWRGEVRPEIRGPKEER